MKIHQVTHLFEPDQLGGAALYTDLARYLRDRGHDVRVTTTFPYYPALHYRPEDRGVLCREETFEGIPLRRISMVLPKRHQGWRRLVPEATYLGALTLRGGFPGWTPDVVLTACPMLAQVAWQHWLYPFRRVPRLAIVQDSMAHAATELGIIRSRQLGRLLHAAERRALRAATMLATISEGMKQRVDAITGGARPCVVVPNWIHDSLQRTAEARAARAGGRAESQLFYSGNFGVKQGLPGFLTTFAAVRGDWTMAVHGGGAEAEALREESSRHAAWLSVGPLLDEPDYVDRLLTASACVVTQMPGVGANFLPSKLLPALATGTPVLAVTEQDSPLGREVIGGDFGAVVAPGDTAGLTATLQAWRRDRGLLARLGEKARARAGRYARETVCGTYERLLAELSNCSKQGAATQ